MELNNQSRVTEFILLGFPGSFQLQILLFVIFLTIYLLILVENIVIIVTVQLNQNLHKPMYYFLSNLSFLEIWYVTVTVPKLLVNFMTEKKTISFIGCMTQLYFFLALASTECALLAVMAYVAICKPLRYPTIMNHRVSLHLAAGSWLSGGLISLMKTTIISRLAYCGPCIINHFFCDVSPLLKLACTDLYLAEITDFILALLILVVPLSTTILSYILIISTILHIPSGQGRIKAFSTCTSHLTVVVIFYAATIFIYAQPKAISSFNSNKHVSVLYTILVPLLNPVIYCLRNKEVKEAMRKTLLRGNFTPQ
ncbi:olfactory receptor 6A2-like [Alligator sinensis]|uniref:Olfactory receptor 6A2-like n=1 Tax=Alligator sinensis TaxID=38654 RepID=A0A3Q0HIS3_ALLSI|nr:olfactory receptor 6A2-like [Alligator sinensis]